nr:Chain B, Synthetic peptide [synthetic construct]
RRRRRSWYFDG